SPPSPPAWVAAMGRKRLITDSYPVVKRREDPTGRSKGELAPELGLEGVRGRGHGGTREGVGGGEEPQPLGADVDEAELELLRQFDLARQYGPCTGITRLQRWHRAQKMGLEPPLEVRQLLRTHLGDPRYQYRSEAAGRLPGQRAGLGGGCLASGRNGRGLSRQEASGTSIPSEAPRRPACFLLSSDRSESRTLPLGSAVPRTTFGRRPERAQSGEPLHCCREAEHRDQLKPKGPVSLHQAPSTMAPDGVEGSDLRPTAQHDITRRMTQSMDAGSGTEGPALDILSSTVLYLQVLPQCCISLEQWL
ncbi:DNA polymerase delta subunit 4, partial [Galemys pyrenaicus]